MRRSVLIGLCIGLILGMVGIFVVIAKRACYAAQHQYKRAPTP